MSRPLGGNAEEIARREMVSKIAHRLFKTDPKISLRKLSEEVKNETGTATSYSTLGPIYRKLREQLSAQTRRIEQRGKNHDKNVVGSAACPAVI